MSKLSYKTLLIIFLSLLIAIIVLWKFVLPKQSVKATWWNDSWNYRQAINISSHTSLESNVYIITSVNIGTTTKAQVDGGDFRFVTQSGDIIPYYISSGTGTTNVTFHIQLTSFPTGAQTVYVYYGNSSVANGFSASDFTTQATNYTIGSLSAEEVGGAPIAYWKFDEGVGTIAYDSSSNQLNGNLLGTTLPTWTSEDQCISGKCLNSTGKGYLNAGNNSLLNINTNSITVETWVKFDFLDYSTNTGKLIGFASKGNPDVAPGISSYGWWFSYDNRNNGKTFKYSCFGNSAGGWNGGNNNFSTSSYTFNQNTWYHLAFTIGQNQGKLFINGKQIGPTVTFTGLQLNNSTNNQYVGSIQGYINMFGSQDEVKIYPYARTAAQIKLDYNSRGSSKGTIANLGIKSNTSPSLSSKLVAYYKFDEKNGTTVYDSINKNNTGTITGAVWSPIKSGIGLSFDGSNDYITLSSSPLDNATVWSITTKLKYINKSKQYEFFLGKNDTGTTGKILLRYNGYISFRGTNGTYYNFSTTSDEINNLNSTLSFVSNGTTIKLYINGLYKSTITPVSTSISLNIIGNAWNDTAWQSVFLLDEVKIYNSALTADEVKMDYNQGSAIQFGATNQTIGGTTTDLNYCIPGDTSTCSPPIAEWNFEENTGTIAKDTSGNNLNGTFGTGNSAPVWTTGKNNSGSGLNFTTNGQYVKVPLGSLASNFYTGTSGKNLSFSLWFKSNNISLTQYLLTNNEPCNNPGSFGIRLSGGIFGFTYYGSGGGGASHSFTPSITLKNNTWYYLEWTKTFGQLGVKAYLNGIPQTVSGDSSNLGSNYSTIVLGAWNGSGSTCTSGVNDNPPIANMSLIGSLDQVKIYNYIRTPAQVAYDYNKGTPIAWWKLDECQGLTAFDASGFGNNGTINIGSSGSQTSAGTCQVGTSAAWTNGASGKINSSLNFDGIDDYVDIPSNFGILQNYTISFWAKHNVANRMTIGSRVNLSSFYWYGDNSWKYTHGGNSGEFYYPKSVSIPYGTWGFFTTTYDGTNVRIYRNGKFEGSQGTAGTANFSNGLYVGQGYAANSTYRFNGQIDDVRLYNYALTSEQIKTLYNGGAINFK